MTIGRPKNRKRTKGAITFRKDGRKSPWMYRYWVGDKRKTGYASTRAIAEDKLNRALVLSADGMLSDNDLTFDEWSKLWLSSRRDIRDKTLNQYRSNLARASGYFGSKKLSKLTPSHLEAMYATLLDTGLSPTTVRQVHVNIGTCLRSAFRKGLIFRDIPSLAEAPSARKRKPIVLSRVEWKSLLDVSAKSSSGLIVEFVLKTGMRINVEALGTTWTQIDFARREVTVGNSKTKAGEYRVIPLDNGLISRLQSLHKIHLSKQLESGYKWNQTNLIFCTSAGNRQSYTNLQKRLLEPMLVEAGVPRLSWHHLRHNCGSYLLSENVPITMVSKILGHANPAITMSVYAHELPEDSEQVRTAMAKIG
ncbi:tyrosine-type recombinase/integrase [Candidatus Lucifugimonas marina]|uniref:Tyrosine-type recombinase/integrase n=1 Tax=Candidatus Lucifugimonas marina TaxID=3038979 RepID=A0AAJ5ZHB9_9CHLR|nr:tyrosine-type recombinase/integrase [SAR202 cluster bacterium JH639]WFG38791.1 tyrosine-type recombinase/integrase [SAR202 cluster bacterium JH1073]